MDWRHQDSSTVIHTGITDPRIIPVAPAAYGNAGTAEELFIYYKKHNKDLPDLAAAHDGERIDLAIAEDVVMKAGDFKIISFGVSISLPPNYEAIITPRSSTFKKYGILMANSCGIVDNSFCGEEDRWGFPGYATRDTEIPFGTRIAQFAIQKCQPKIKFFEVPFMKDKSRGGFGSTGD